MSVINYLWIFIIYLSLSLLKESTLGFYYKRLYICTALFYFIIFQSKCFGAVGCLPDVFHVNRLSRTLQVD